MPEGKSDMAVSVADLTVPARRRCHPRFLPFADQILWKHFAKGARLFSLVLEAQ
jgi:hypothetical protein